MRRGGLLLILGLLVIAVLAVVLLFPTLLSPQAQTTTEPATATPVQNIEVLAAAVTIPRGSTITDDMLKTETIKATAKTADMLDDSNRSFLRGKTAARDIQEGQIIVKNYVVELEGYLTGSLASLYIPQGSVAVAIPADRVTTVGYALQPGDHIDVIATFLVVDVDEKFQTLLPNYAYVAAPNGEYIRDIPLGEQGTLPGATNVVVVPNPNEPGQRPRAVTQLTLQNVLVLRMGDWAAIYQPTAVPTTRPLTGTVQAPPQAPAGQQGAQVQPSPTPIPRPDIVTLALPRQDALVLMYLMNTGATIEFALRPAGDEATDYAPEPVTLYFVFQNYRIPQPPVGLPFSTEPGLWPLRVIPDQTSDPLFLTPRPHPNPTWQPK